MLINCCVFVFTVAAKLQEGCLRLHMLQRAVRGDRPRTLLSVATHHRDARTTHTTAMLQDALSFALRGFTRLHLQLESRCDVSGLPRPAPLHSYSATFSFPGCNIELRIRMSWRTLNSDLQTASQVDWR
jgi:hypothetical protein